jgi:hypothetical protein
MRHDERLFALRSRPLVPTNGLIAISPRIVAHSDEVRGSVDDKSAKRRCKRRFRNSLPGDKSPLAGWRLPVNLLGQARQAVSGRKSLSVGFCHHSWREHRILPQSLPELTRLLAANLSLPFVINSCVCHLLGQPTVAPPRPSATPPHRRRGIDGWSTDGFSCIPPRPSATPPQRRRGIHGWSTPLTADS